MKHLIIINGKSGAGKDTFVQAVAAAIDPVMWDIYNLSSVQPIKDILEEIGVDNPNKDEDWRNLVVDMKVALNRYHRYADKIAIDAVKSRMSLTNNTIVFLHVRESVSIDYIKKHSPFNWKVSTMWLERSNTPAVANDESYSPEVYDFRITNDGTLEELKAQAVEFAGKFSE